MRELTKEESMTLYAGGITSSILNAIVKGITVVTDLGRYFGSSLRRLFDKRLCDY
ncbi:MAG: hypothetical protein IKF36_03015 [Bacilli bacterium]|nr:hypothetical protein [Bacilli bacterium]